MLQSTMRGMTVAAALAMAGAAVGQSETFLFGSPVVGDFSSPFEMNLNPMGPGNYTHATVQMDWVAGPGDPWSDEAIWGLANNPLATATVFYVDPGPSPNSASNGSAVSLSWDVYFSEMYTADNPLWFIGAQAFSGSSATWGNLAVTIDAQAAAAPTTVTNLGVVATTADVFSIDTIGSGFDTELGLFNGWGGVMAVNDDIGGGIFQSEIAGLQLAAGEYYFNLGGFNTIYGSGGFEALVDTSLGSDGGEYVGQINGVEFSGTLAFDTNTWFRFQVVPTPGAGVTLALAGLVGLRRRRG